MHAGTENRPNGKLKTRKATGSAPEKLNGRSLDNRHRRRLVVAGAVLGAFIGPLGLWLDVQPKLGAEVRGKFGAVSEVISRWATSIQSLDGGATGLLILAVPFVATLVLMPLFVRWLEKRLGHAPAAFYFQSALGGIVFGAVATGLIAWGLMIAAVIAGSIQNPGAATAEGSAATVAGAALVFGPLMGLAAPFLFIPSILALGIPFGLLSGALVRRFAREEEEQARAKH